MGKRQIDLVLRPRRADDRCAQRLCPLAGDQADAAGGRMEEKRRFRAHLEGLVE
ncbi:hypothetical protein D3C87_1927200 [compost metagenome]